MTIADAFKLITIPDYVKYMEQICDLLNRKPESSFKDYVEAVTFDPGSWFNAFPEKLKSSSALGKPKTAMLSLLKHEEVIDSLGDDFCRKATIDISTYWKNKLKDLLDERQHKNGTEGFIGVSPFEHESSIDDGGDVNSECASNNRTCELAIVKNYNKELGKRVDALETEVDDLKEKNEKLKELLYKYVMKVHESDSIAIEMYATLIKHW